MINVNSLRVLLLLLLLLPLLPYSPSHSPIHPLPPDLLLLTIHILSNGILTNSTNNTLPLLNLPLLLPRPLHLPQVRRIQKRLRNRNPQRREERHQHAHGIRRTPDRLVSPINPRPGPGRKAPAQDLRHRELGQRPVHAEPGHEHGEEDVEDQRGCQRVF